ncbi:hypothetical protein P368_13595 [Comamonas thiooxydans]|nr:hypothetical protein P365_14935 [Comamonas thiooxydans]KGH11338.1 hypothetical protein P368_13595 [Comamonas thiooxydans]
MVQQGAREYRPYLFVASASGGFAQALDKAATAHEKTARNLHSRRLFLKRLRRVFPAGETD